MLNVRPATQNDFERLDGRMPKTSRAIALERGETLWAVTGYYLHEGNAVLFCSINPAVRNEPGFGRYVLRFARQQMKEIAAQGFKVLSGADAEIEGADRLLLHLGFKPEPGTRGVYSWHGHH